jgi:hypothetical protein
VTEKHSWKKEKSHNAVRNQRLGFEATKETDGYTKRERGYEVSVRERERERGERGQCGWMERGGSWGTTCSELEIDGTWSVAAHCGGGR